MLPSLYHLYEGILYEGILCEGIFYEGVLLEDVLSEHIGLVSVDKAANCQSNSFFR